MADSISEKVGFIRSEPSHLEVHFRGNWLLAEKIVPFSAVENQFNQSQEIRRVSFATQNLQDWDSTLPLFLTKVIDRCEEKGLECDPKGLPEGVQRILQLSRAVPEVKDAKTKQLHTPFFESVGQKSLSLITSINNFISFLGAITLSTFRMVTGKAQYRGLDLMEVLQDCGPKALPIVSLISFLFGLILAYVGSVQLAQFGATIFVADLVTIGMLREMGAIMTAIIMAGRTGAAFAAQLGTMKVTQEIDALETMAISPQEFLILPRMVALILMMPLLTLFADLIGMLGGAFVTIGTSDVTMMQYFTETQSAFDFTDFNLGLFKSVIFGIIIAFAGCIEGMRCGGSASAVGDATTRAVVQSITWIIAVDGLFAILTNALGI